MKKFILAKENSATEQIKVTLKREPIELEMLELEKQIIEAKDRLSKLQHLIELSS